MLWAGRFLWRSASCTFSRRSGTVWVPPEATYHVCNNLLLIVQRTHLSVTGHTDARARPIRTAARRPARHAAWRAWNLLPVRMATGTREYSTTSQQCARALLNVYAVVLEPIIVMEICRPKPSSVAMPEDAIFDAHRSQPCPSHHDARLITRIRK